MKLFECTNGFMGESYVRVYAWAANKQDAIDMAKEKFGDQISSRGIGAIELFNARSRAFCTEPSSSGFDIG